jgi:hypothetical protein
LPASARIGTPPARRARIAAAAVIAIVAALPAAAAALPAPAAASTGTGASSGSGTGSYVLTATSAGGSYTPEFTGNDYIGVRIPPARDTRPGACLPTPRWPGRAILIRGRRRVGKSRLVEEFIDRAEVPSVFFTASGQPTVEADLALFTEPPPDAGQLAVLLISGARFGQVQSPADQRMPAAGGISQRDRHLAGHTRSILVSLRFLGMPRAHSHS